MGTKLIDQWPMNQPKNGSFLFSIGHLSTGSRRQLVFFSLFCLFQLIFNEFCLGQSTLISAKQKQNYKLSQPQIEKRQMQIENVHYCHSLEHQQDILMAICFRLIQLMCLTIGPYGDDDDDDNGGSAHLQLILVPIQFVQRAQ